MNDDDDDGDDDEEEEEKDEKCILIRTHFPSLASLAFYIIYLSI